MNEFVVESSSMCIYNNEPHYRVVSVSPHLPHLLWSASSRKTCLAAGIQQHSSSSRHCLVMIDDQGILVDNMEIVLWCWRPPGWWLFQSRRKTHRKRGGSCESRPYWSCGIMRLLVLIVFSRIRKRVISTTLQLKRVEIEMATLDMQSSPSVESWTFGDNLSREAAMPCSLARGLFWRTFLQSTINKNRWSALSFMHRGNQYWTQKFEFDSFFCSQSTILSTPLPTPEGSISIDHGLRVRDIIRLRTKYSYISKQ